MARALRRVSVFAMQSEEDARRIVGLGAPPERVFVTGNLKVDAAPDASDADAEWRRRLGVPPGRRLWIAGSTHPGEEAIVLGAYRRLAPRFPGLGLLLAPRRPERGAEVERLVGEHGLRAVRRSALPAEGAGDAVVILDTVGELASLYGLADVVFVGGSLVPTGGHNMLEPAQRRRAVVFGPHTENFRESAALLLAVGGAVRVDDADALGREMGRLLGDDDLRGRMGAAAFAAVAARQGALGRTLALIEEHLAGGAAPSR